LYYNPIMEWRFFVALWRAIQTFLATLWRVIRQLFHEAAGTMFLLLAVGGAVSTWRYWKQMTPGAHAPWIVGLAAAFTAMMAYFALASFRSARRVR
jgi:glycerol uptake facilitator-like aquaporin